MLTTRAALPSILTHYTDQEQDEDDAAMDESKAAKKDRAAAVKTEGAAAVKGEGEVVLRSRVAKGVYNVLFAEHVATKNVHFQPGQYRPSHPLPSTLPKTWR